MKFKMGNIKKNLLIFKYVWVTKKLLQFVLQKQSKVI